jgi:hypothetical protein
VFDATFLRYWGLAYPLAVLVRGFIAIRHGPNESRAVLIETAIWGLEAAVLFGLLWAALHAVEARLLAAP